jgi:hypothetical protein
MFSLSGLNASILGYVAALYAVRLVAAVVTVFVVLALSQALKNTMLAMSVSVLALGFPLMLELFGVSAFGAFGMLPVLSGNFALSGVFQSGSGVAAFQSALQVFAPVAVAAAGLAYLFRSFGSATLRRRS